MERSEHEVRLDLPSEPASVRVARNAAATLAPKLLPDERTIDWSQPAVSIVRRVRAFAPDPGAVCTFRGGRLKVLRAATRPTGGYILAESPKRGEIRIEEGGSPAVHGLGRDAVALLEVAPAGRKRMSGAEWARGARIRPGEQLT